MEDIFVKKADLHLHSQAEIRARFLPLLYDSVQTTEEILNRVFELNIKIISITSHNSLAGYFEAKKIVQERGLGILLVPGCEVSSKEGHILAYNIEKEIEKGIPAKETIKEIRKQGGIAVAAHPYSIIDGLGDRIFKLDLDAIEVYNSSARKSAVEKSLSAAKKLGLPCTSGSDAHMIEEIGRGLTLLPKNIESSEDVIEHIKKGDFDIMFSKTRILKRIPKHIYKNLRLQFRI